MIVPMIDITGKQVGWIDHLKLDSPGNVYQHDDKLFTYTSRGMLQEIEPATLDPSDIVPMTEEIE